MPLADIGVIGLAVMGQNLVLNLHDHGFSVAVYNRSFDKTQQFILQNPQASGIIACEHIQQLITTLKTPRKILLMVRAGEATDNTLTLLQPYLENGDMVIDGGNAYFEDTQRRYLEMKKYNIHFIGAGISGGEEGARFGPSIMPGGDINAWPSIAPIFNAIAAKVDNEPCCRWMGEESSGHFVKMVHNGIEYGDMQLIAEIYNLLHHGAGIDYPALSEIFTSWNSGVLDSYLIEITSHIFKQLDDDGTPLLDKILDTAGQKGTGKWAVNNALENGTPLTLISEAVFARALSSMKEARVFASSNFLTTNKKLDVDKNSLITAAEQALYAAKIISYTQGFMLLKEAMNKYQWTLDFADIASIWRGGCIIRSRFLNDIATAFKENPGLDNLLLAPFFTQAIKENTAGLRTILKYGIDGGIPLPAMSSALAFLDGYTSAQSPANLIQAQRDYFGAHTYERTDKPPGIFYHTNWTGLSGNTSSGSYQA